MRKIAVLICLIISSKAYSQLDTTNEHYFTNLSLELSRDSTVKDIKYICEHYNNSQIKAQHLYVKFKKDTVDGYWRVGKCFHYYESGQLQFVSNIDLTTRKYDGITASLDLNGDTLSAAIWGNYHNRLMPPNSTYSVDSVGNVYELHPDMVTTINYKKGKRKSAETDVFTGYYTVNLSKVYYKKDGTIDRVKDNTAEVLEIEKQGKMKSFIQVE